MKPQQKKVLIRLASAAVLVAVAVLVWLELRPNGLGEGFASANGRIEATEVDVASKLAGRLLTLNVDEGDFVEVGQVLARMDTQVLDAQLNQARAEVRKAQNATRTAHSQVALRISEKATAEAVVRQRQAELVAAQKRHQRSETLVARNAMARQQLDDDLAAYQSAQAALSAARSQVLSAQAGIEASIITGTGNQIYGAMRERNFDIIVGRGGGGAERHPHSSLRTLVYNPDNRDEAKLSNFQGWRTSFYSPELNQLIERAEVEPDASQQLAQYRQIQEQLDQQVGAILPVSQMTDTVLVYSDVTDFQGHPAATTRYKDVYKKR